MADNIRCMWKMNESVVKQTKLKCIITGASKGLSPAQQHVFSWTKHLLPIPLLEPNFSKMAMQTFYVEKMLLKTLSGKC